MEVALAEAPDQLSALAAMAWAWMLAFLPRLGAALLLLAIGLFVAGWAARMARAALLRTRRVDATIIPVVGTTTRYAILILVLIAVLGQLGFQTTSLLAMLGAAGLAIGLALQGTLSNIAAGIMLLYLRPFQVGDFIETVTVSGIVKSVGLFATELETFDGLYVFAPNSEIWNKSLKNHSRNPRRLMSIPIGISYEADVDDARRILLAMAAEDPRVLHDPAPYAYVDKYGDNSVDLVFRAWAPTSVFWDAQRTMIEEAKRRLQAAGIEIPFPQRIVHVMPSPAGAEAGPIGGGASQEGDSRQGRSHAARHVSASSK
jgi:small conductance mechanosensitive channel